MGIGSILGSLASFIPGVGPLGPMIGSGIDGLSDVLGGASKSTQEQNNKRDSLKLLLENSKLNRDKFAEAAPGHRLGTSIRASLASNFKPSTINWGPNGFKPGAIARGEAQMPTASGGAAGGMASLNPDTKSLTNQVMHDELIAQMRGGETGGGNARPGDGSMLRPGAKMDGTGTDKAMPKGIGESSTGDSILGGLGLGTSILSVLAKLKGIGHGGGNGTNYEPNDENGVG